MFVFACSVSLFDLLQQQCCTPAVYWCKLMLVLAQLVSICG